MSRAMPMPLSRTRRMPFPSSCSIVREDRHPPSSVYFAGVVQEIDDHLSQPGRIRLKPNRLFRKAEGQRDAFGRRSKDGLFRPPV